MLRNSALLPVALLGLFLVASVWAQPSNGQPPARAAHRFQGYWIGVDPVDGGDSRRSIVVGENGTLALAGRDTVLTLCDGTDRGFASFDDGEVISRNVMESHTLTIECFNNSATVVLNARYELIDKGLMLEHTTRQDGSPVSTIVLHKVSQE